MYTTDMAVIITMNLVFSLSALADGSTGWTLFMLRSSYIVEMLQNRIITMHANPTVMKYLNMGYKTVSWMINSFWENIYMYTYQKNSIQENLAL